MSAPVADAQNAGTATEQPETVADDTIIHNSQGGNQPAPGTNEVDTYRDEAERILESLPEEIPAADALEDEDDETLQDDRQPPSGTQTPAAPEAGAAPPANPQSPLEQPLEDEVVDLQNPPKRKHVNLARMGEEKAKLVLYLDRNPDVPLAEAVKSLGLSLTQEQAQEALHQEPQGPKSLAEAKDLLKSLRLEHNKATEELDFAKASEIFSKMEDLRDQMFDLRIAEEQAEHAAYDKFDREWKAAEQLAARTYRDYTNPNSPLAKRVVELDALLKKTGNPLFESADKPYKLAQMAANELGIAPQDPDAPPANPSTPATAQQPPAPPKPVQVPSPVQPASGRARTQSINPDGTIEQLVDSVRDEDSYEAAKAKILSST